MRMNEPQRCGLVCTALIFFLTSLSPWAVAQSGASPNSAAQSSPEASLSQTQRLTFEQALRQTLERNPELTAFGYQLQAQHARVEQAAWRPAPELGVEVENFLGTGERSGLEGSETTLSIGWVFERGVRERRIGAAQAQVNLLQTQTDLMRLDAAAQTARRYLESLANQARMENVEQSIALAEETIAIIRAGVEAGRIPNAELARAEADLALRELDLEDLEHELVTSNQRLAAQWDEPNPVFKRVAGDVLALPSGLAFADLRAGLPQTPDYALLLSEERAKEAELALAQSQDKASWRLNAGLRHLEASGDQALVAGISIPLGQAKRNSSRINEARAVLARSQAEQAVARRRMETALFVFHQQFQHNLHVANALRETVIPKLEVALEETRRAYELGRYGYSEWRAVQVELVSARDALIEAAIAAHANLIEIERFSGTQIEFPGATP